MKLSPYFLLSGYPRFFLKWKRNHKERRERRRPILYNTEKSKYENFLCLRNYYKHYSFILIQQNQTPKLKKIWVRILHWFLRSDPMASLEKPLSLPTLRRCLSLSLHFFLLILISCFLSLIFLGFMADYRGWATSIKKVRFFLIIILKFL